MKELLSSSAVSVSMTIDLWTSRAKQGYISITASFISSDFKLYDILLDVKYLSYPHTAERIKDQINHLISEWNLTNKVVAIATDNGSNMVKAVRLIDGVIRIPCTAHILQLIIKKGLEPATVLVLRAKRLIQFFMSPKQMERLKDVQIELNYDNILGAIGDVSTRWNSTYLAWDRLLYLRDAIEELAAKLFRDRDSNVKKDGRQIKKINLSDDEWNFMESLVTLLSPFEEATTLLGGSNYTTLSLMHPVISDLKAKFKDQALSASSFTEPIVIDLTKPITILDDEDNEELIEFLSENDDEIIHPTTKTKIKINLPMPTEGILDQIKIIISQAFDKYWNELSDLGLIASLLDPRVKGLSFVTPLERIKAKDLIKDELQKLKSKENNSDSPTPIIDIPEFGMYYIFLHNF